MRRINIPTKQISQFSGEWVVIDSEKDMIIAVGKTLDDVASLVSDPKSLTEPMDKSPYVFLVPRKDEGPYIFSFL